MYLQTFKLLGFAYIFRKDLKVNVISSSKLLKSVEVQLSNRRR